jgi:DNA polymerase
MVADYAAIEARDVFWLAEDEDGLDDFRASDAGEGPEVYCVMAEQIFGHEVNADDHPTERFVGKQSILGCGFGMGWEKYMDTCRKFGVSLDEKTCRLAIDTYRDVHGPVKQMWYDQEAAAKAAVMDPGVAVKCGKVLWSVRGIFLHCRLPGGRLLSYCRPRLSSVFNFRFHVLKDDGARASTLSVNAGGPMMGEARSYMKARYRAQKICDGADWELLDKRPSVREQTVLKYEGIDSKTKKWTEQETYGGKLVENITQATARDQIAEAMLRADDGGLYDVLLSVHDELICEVDKGRGDLREFEAIMAENPVWSPDVPLVAKGWRGERYRK